MKDVVVLLPGILGSALEKNGKSLWDISSGALGRAFSSFGGSIKELAVRDDGSTGDGVTATRLLPDAQILPFFWKVDGYAELSAYIVEKLGLVPGENYFEFPYDWRLDNRVSARRLAGRAMDWLESRRRRHADARLVFVGHSMGGLVARYFIEVLGGWRHTRMLVTLGTPHRGSVKALDLLANGLRKKIGPLTLIDLTRLVKSLPSAYQLLPIYPCVGRTEDSLQGLEMVEEASVGDLDLARARAGIAFHREIERAVETNRKEAGYGYRLVPVVGVYQPTLQSALLTDEGVRPLKTYKGESLLGGDGTVPRLSATPIELSKAKVESFAACPHAALQNFDPVRIQMRAAIEDADISELKAVEDSAISLEVPDAFATGETVRAYARCTGTARALRALITNIQTQAHTEHELRPGASAGGWQELDAGALPAGGYRIRVTAGEAAEPISDLFVVINPEGDK